MKPPKQRNMHGGQRPGLDSPLSLPRAPVLKEPMRLDVYTVELHTEFQG